MQTQLPALKLAQFKFHHQGFAWRVDYQPKENSNAWQIFVWKNVDVHTICSSWKLCNPRNAFHLLQEAIKAKR